MGAGDIAVIGQGNPGSIAQCRNSLVSIGFLRRRQGYSVIIQVVPLQRSFGETAPAATDFQKTGVIAQCQSIQYCIDFARLCDLERFALVDKYGAGICHPAVEPCRIKIIAQVIVELDITLCPGLAVAFELVRYFPCQPRRSRSTRSIAQTATVTNEQFEQGYRIDAIPIASHPSFIATDRAVPRQPQQRIPVADLRLCCGPCPSSAQKTNGAVRQCDLDRSFSQSTIDIVEHDVKTTRGDCVYSMRDKPTDRLCHCSFSGEAVPSCDIWRVHNASLCNSPYAFAITARTVIAISLMSSAIRHGFR